MSELGLIPNDGDRFVAAWDVVRSNARGVFCEKSVAFKGRLFSIFNYGLASYAHFGGQGSIARDLRGITFDVTDASNPVLVSLPPAKFFSHKEVGSDLPKCGGQLLVMDKRDGSLLSSVLVGDEVLLKTQNSFDNEQSVRSTQLMHTLGLAQEVARLHKGGVCVSFEYTAPDNRIIVRYDTEELRLLQVRLMDTGETIVPGERLRSFLLERGCVVLADAVVDYDVCDAQDAERIIEAVRTRCATDQGVEFLNKLNKSELWEGVVLCYQANGHMLKVKTDQYTVAHIAVDWADSPEVMFNYIVRGHLDDLLVALADFPDLRKPIEDLHSRITSVISGWMEQVDNVVLEARRANIPHREFVEKARAMGILFGCAMNTWVGKETDYLKILAANRKEYLGF